jgi:glutamyl-tRNA synthetase
MLGFFFQADDTIEYDADALPPDADEARLVLDASEAALEQLNDWSAAAIAAALRAALIDSAGMKPRTAFGPLRTAVSGRRVSPPLFESMEILGKESTLGRLERLRVAL